MDATSFELNVSLPADVSLAAAMRELATHAARYAGCAGPSADRFGSVVESVVLRCFAETPDASSVAVIVRRSDGPVEFLIACGRRFTVVASRDPHVTVSWTHEAGLQMCRVARAMPADV